jgi:hypothetical protein
VRAGLLRPTQAQRYRGLIMELRDRLGPARDLIRRVPGYGYRLDPIDSSEPNANERGDSSIRTAPDSMRRSG